MYNYSKNNVTINAEVMAKIDKFNKVARTLATESCEHTTEKKRLEETIENLVRDGKTAEDEQKALDTLNDEWAKRQRELNLELFGGKVDGVKVEGVCDIVSNNLYKSYCEHVINNKTKNYRDNIKAFCESIINQDTIKDGAFNHLYNDILITMSSVKYNSNKNIAEGCAYITTVNKRTYKKMLLGAIADIVDNNKTLKVKKSTKKADK